MARIKATLMLCYGYVTLYAPPSLITSRIEVNILASINPHFSNIKETTVKENLIRCVDLIGKVWGVVFFVFFCFFFPRHGGCFGSV